MSYLQDGCHYQDNVALFRLEQLENKIKKQLLMINLRKPSVNQGDFTKFVKNSENELTEIRNQIKGINWYAFFFGLALYHTQHIFRNKVLLNEMGKSAVLTHMSISIGVGLAFGGFVGYSTAKSMKLYNKFNSVSKTVRRTKEDLKF